MENSHQTQIFPMEFVKNQKILFENSKMDPNTLHHTVCTLHYILNYTLHYIAHYITLPIILHHITLHNITMFVYVEYINVTVKTLQLYYE